ncbi:MAG: WG repeat-containing protein, partial [Bacteroidota bacterium]
IDTIKHRREKKKEPSVYHGIFHGQFQWEVFMEDGSVLYGAEADPEIVEKYKTGRYGFYEKALDYPPFENSYFLMRANKLVSYERIERGGDYQNPLRWVKQDQYFGLINSMGELVVPIECDKVGVFQEGLICLVKDGKLGFVNEKGETVIPFEYDDDYNALPDFAFVNGHSVVYRDKKYGVIDAKGQTKVPCSFDIITYFDGKEVLGFRNGKWELVGW